jgi:broad specificity phosphatase PhoE
MTGELILIRHAAVSASYHGRCYGCSDVELSLTGEKRSQILSRLLAKRPITRVVHSGLQRTQYLADRLAKELGQHAECCEGLQERDYGEWELEHWDTLHQRFGDDMLRVISEPATYRPGGGETTFEMRDRVLEWLHTLPPDGLTVAVTHGGPIAVLRGAQKVAPVADWLKLIPSCGEFVSLSLQ